MTTTINASTSSGLVQTADTSGILQLQTANTAAMTIDASQNVGIGTASPSDKLQVTGGYARIDNSGSSALRLYNSTTQVAGVGLQGWSGLGSANDLTVGTVSSNNAIFMTGLTERMRITSAGNVGIGTPTPGVKLHVMEQASADLGVAFEAATAGYAVNMTLYGNTASGSRYNNITCKYGSTEQWYIGGNGTDATIAFRTSGTERARINAYGIGLGGATPSSGTGITFPAAQSASSDANTLDDYEEGTWTPTAAGNTGSLTSYTSGGNYTKVGRYIYLTGYISLTTVGTAGSTLVLGGLPFNTYDAGLNTERPCVAVCREDASTGVIYTAFLNRGATTGLISSLTNGAISWTNGYRYTFSLYYQVA